MNVTQGSRRNGRRLCVVLLLAGCAAMVTAAPARACDKHEKAKLKNSEKSKVTAVLAGDKTSDSKKEKKLHKRIGRLEAQLEELSAQLEKLNGVLAGAPRASRRRDGRSEYAAPDHGHGLSHGGGRYGGHAAPPHAPVPPVPPVAPVPPMPPMPPMPGHGGERMSEVQADAFHAFQERMHEWQEEWRERQERWHARQAETMTEWRERMDDWRDRQRGAAREIADHARDIGRRVRDEVRQHVGEARKRSRSARSRRGGSERGYVKVGESGSVSFSLSGENANLLHELLAPNYVRVIVSRNGDDISVRGTEPELHVLSAFLELLNWTDRTRVFEQMIEGDRESRTYELGSDRSGLLYKMLAPGDVKVIVSSSEDAVAIRATDNEHEVLSNALVLLHWLD